MNPTTGRKMCPPPPSLSIRPTEPPTCLPLSVHSRSRINPVDVLFNGIISSSRIQYSAYKHPPIPLKGSAPTFFRICQKTKNRHEGDGWRTTNDFDSLLEHSPVLAQNRQNTMPQMSPPDSANSERGNRNNLGFWPVSSSPKNKDDSAAARDLSKSDSQYHRRRHSGSIASGVKENGNVFGGGSGDGGELSPGRQMRHSYDEFHNAIAGRRRPGAPSLGPLQQGFGGGRGSAGGAGRFSGGGGGGLALHDLDALIDFRMAALRDSTRRQRPSPSPMEPLRRSASLGGPGRASGLGSVSSGGKGVAASVEYAAVRREIEREREAMSRRTQQQLRQLEGDDRSGSGGGQRVADNGGGFGGESERDEESYSPFGPESDESQGVSTQKIRHRMHHTGAEGEGDAVAGGDAGAGTPPSPPEEITGVSQDGEDYLDEDIADEREESLYLAESLAEELQDNVVPLAAAGRRSKAPAVVCDGHDGGNALGITPAAPVVFQGAAESKGIGSVSSSATIPDGVVIDSSLSSADEVSVVDGSSGEVVRGDGGVGGMGVCMRSQEPEDVAVNVHTEEVVESEDNVRGDIGSHSPARTADSKNDDEGYDSGLFEEDSGCDDDRNPSEVASEDDLCRFYPTTTVLADRSIQGDDLSHPSERSAMDVDITATSARDSTPASGVGITLFQDLEMPFPVSVQTGAAASSLSVSGDLHSPLLLHQRPSGRERKVGEEEVEGTGLGYALPGSGGSLASMEAAVAERSSKVEEMREKLNGLQGTRARVRAKQILAEQLELLEVCVLGRCFGCK